MEFEDRYKSSLRLQYDCLLFDLDDTLYPLSAGIARECGQNIKDYMVKELGIDKSKVVELSNLLYKNYGTTMAGLRAIGYDFGYDEYHSYVHGRLPYQNIKPDPVLRSLLLSLPLRKVNSNTHQNSFPNKDKLQQSIKQILTNGDKVHAAKVVSRLGLEDCFEGIICFETLNPIHRNVDEDEIGIAARPEASEIFDIVGHFARSDGNIALPKTPIVCKPSEAAIEKALRIAEIDPHRTLFFEDSVRNIQAGKRLGLHTVLIGSSKKTKDADFALESIHNIKEAIPELWDATGKLSCICHAGKVIVETPVTA